MPDNLRTIYYSVLTKSKDCKISPHIPEFYKPIPRKIIQELCSLQVTARLYIARMLIKRYCNSLSIFWLNVRQYNFLLPVGHFLLDYYIVPINYSYSTVRPWSLWYMKFGTYYKRWTVFSFVWKSWNLTRSSEYPKINVIMCEDG
jgi:hypothetical protein